MEKEYLKQVESLLETNQYEADGIFEKISPVYLTSNENLEQLLNEINLIKAKVLSVTGSGDMPIEMASRGASQVDCIDVNLLSKYMLNLKVAAIKGLSQTDYISFFSQQQSNFLSQDIYNQAIKEFLSVEDQIFWDYIYNFLDQKKMVTHDMVKSNFFMHGINAFNVYSQSNTYLKKDNFDSLQDKIDTVKFNFINKSIFDDNLKLQKDSYNMIYISNVADYRYLKAYGFDFSGFRYFVDKNLSPYLIDGGQIISYLYGYVSALGPEMKQYSEMSREKHFANDKFTLIPSEIDSNIHGGLYVSKK